MEICLYSYVTHKQKSLQWPSRVSSALWCVVFLLPWVICYEALYLVSSLGLCFVHNFINLHKNMPLGIVTWKHRRWRRNPLSIKTGSCSVGQNISSRLQLCVYRVLPLGPVTWVWSVPLHPIYLRWILILSYYVSHDLLNWLFSEGSYCTFWSIFLFCLVIVISGSRTVSYISLTSWWPCGWRVFCVAIGIVTKVTDKTFSCWLSIGGLCFDFRLATPV
jgi:hypothetical protein